MLQWVRAVWPVLSRTGAPSSFPGNVIVEEARVPAFVSAEPSRWLDDQRRTRSSVVASVLRKGFRNESAVGLAEMSRPRAWPPKQQRGIGRGSAPEAAARKAALAFVLSEGVTRMVSADMRATLETPFAVPGRMLRCGSKMQVRRASRRVSHPLDSGKISAYSATAVVSSKVFTVVSFPATNGFCRFPATFLDRPQMRCNMHREHIVNYR